MSKKFDSSVISEELINLVAKTVQDRIGVEYGDVAGSFFSDGVLKDNLRHYVELELIYADKCPCCGNDSEFLPTQDEIEKVSRAFCRILGEWLTREQQKEVLTKLNDPELPDGCCPTQDYYDTNEAMAEAIAKVMGQDFYDHGHGLRDRLWNSAWDLAIENKYWFNTSDSTIVSFCIKAKGQTLAQRVGARLGTYHSGGGCMHHHFEYGEHDGYVIMGSADHGSCRGETEFFEYDEDAVYLLIYADEKDSWDIRASYSFESIHELLAWDESTPWDDFEGGNEALMKESIKTAVVEFRKMMEGVE